MSPLPVSFSGCLWYFHQLFSFPALLCFETTPCLSTYVRSGIRNAFCGECLPGKELALLLVPFKILRTFGWMRVGDCTASLQYASKTFPFSQNLQFFARNKPKARRTTDHPTDLLPQNWSIHRVSFPSISEEGRRVARAVSEKT
jgi:hypothetical protein